MRYFINQNAVTVGLVCPSQGQTFIASYWSGVVVSRTDDIEFHWPDGFTLRYSRHKEWDNSGRKPYFTTQYFKFARKQTMNCSGFNASFPDFVYYEAPIYFGGNDPVHALNTAIESFFSQLGDQSSWGTNLAEAHQSVSTVENRLHQLTKFATNLRKGNFSQAASTLGIGVPKGVKSGAKNFANNFLEYHFGWVPACQDIHDALSTMGKADFGTRRVVGSGHAGNGQSYVDGQPDGKDKIRIHWTFTARVGAVLRISNDSAFLANQMGLVNPLSVAWDLVPYSFVVDWFTNVGSVLNSLTGLVGISTDKSWNITASDGNFNHSYLSNDGLFGTSANQTNFVLIRNDGIPGETLEIKPFKGFSPVRGLTALSLLLQKL